MAYGLFRFDSVYLFDQHAKRLEMKPLTNTVRYTYDESAMFGLQRIKSKIVEQISHEFRTPLTSIIGFAEILKDEIPVNEQQRIEYASYIQREGLRLTKLIDDLIELDALEEGQSGLHLREWDIQQTIKYAVSLISEIAYGKFITISFDLPEEPLLLNLIVIN